MSFRLGGVILLPPPRTQNEPLRSTPRLGLSSNNGIKWKKNDHPEKA